MTDLRGIEIKELYGNCPVQADGTIDGWPFYFRARGERWSFSIGKNPVGDPHWFIIRPYGGGAGEAGWMTEDEARLAIAEAAALWRQGHPGH